jgi:hypothetical protein
MATNKDWIPERDVELAAFAQKWAVGLADTKNLSAFGWNPQEVTLCLGRTAAFLEAWEAYTADDSTGKRLTKNEARDAMKDAMRDFANTSIRYNKLMTDEQKLSYGIHPADTTHTPSPAPTTFPEAEADTSVLRQLTIHFWDSATKKRGKPHGVHGAEIRWAMLDAPPATEAALTHSDFDTASPFTLKFGEEDRGKRVYYTLRWESPTGQKGPDSAIYSAVIP